jgi:hypothetical protein
MKTMTLMEDVIMLWTGCNRQLANYIANEILNIEEESQEIKI